MSGPPDGGGHVAKDREDRIPRGVRAMSFVRWGLVVAMGAVAILSIAYATGATKRISSHGESATLYYCPMHPSVVQDHPGECPVCSMTLVPKAQGGATGRAEPTSGTAPPGLAQIDLPLERIQLIGMRTAKVERAALGETLRVAGVVAANERGLAEISVRFSGWVQQLMAAETGRRVKRGEVLATVFSPEVQRAEQEYLAARGWGGKPTSTLAPSTEHHDEGSLGGLAADARHRLELLGIAPSEIDAMAARGKPGDSVPIRSPVEGYVTARNVVAGAAIQAGAPMFEIADLSKVWVLADVFERDAARLRIGQNASLELTAYPGERFTGRVRFLAPTLDASTRTLRLRLELGNRPGPGGVKLRPGMSGDVTLELASSSGLVIPTEALVDTGEHQYVFVSKAEGRFEPRLVRVAGRAGDKVQISEGLAEGETVVTTGNFLLDSESRLRAAVDGRAPGR